MSWKSVALLGFAAALLHGCGAAALTALGAGLGVAADTGVQQGLAGSASRTFASPADDVYQATRETLNTLAMRVVDETSGADERTIVASAGDRRVEIVVHRLTPKATRVKVVARHHAVLRDRATADQVIERTQQTLDTRFAAGPNDGDASRTFAAPGDQVHRATLQVLQNLAMPVVDDTARNDSRTIVASAGDRRIEIAVHELTEKATRMTVAAKHHGAQRDRATADQIVDRTQQTLDTQFGTGPNDNDAARTFAAPAEQVRRATLDALASLAMPILDAAAGASPETIVAEAGDRRLEIGLQDLTAKATRMTVAAKYQGNLRDRATADQVIERTQQTLEMQFATGPNDADASRTLAAPPEQVRRATLDALANLAMPVVNDTAHADGRTIVASAGDRRVEIALQALTPNATQITVAAKHRGGLRDRATADQVVDRTQQTLDDQVGAVPNDGDAARTFAAPADHVYGATLDALKALAMPVTDDVLDAEGRTIVARAGDRRVEIALQFLTRNATRMTVAAKHHGSLRDRATADQVVEQTQDVLDTRATQISDRDGAASPATTARRAPKR